MPPRGGGAESVTAPGVMYTNNGTENPPAVLGSVSAAPSAVSYADGFLHLSNAGVGEGCACGGQGITVSFVQGQALRAFTPFVDLSGVKPDVKREIMISGGFLNSLASTADPKAFVYAFDGGAFPNVPLIQPRLSSVEEWRFVNHNNDEHPIHVHVNDFQVTEYYDPTVGLRTAAGQVGAWTTPAHRPNHADRRERDRARDPCNPDQVRRLHRHLRDALPSAEPRRQRASMMLVNVIPAVSSYAVAIPGAPGKSDRGAHL